MFKRKGFIWLLPCLLSPFWLFSPAKAQLPGENSSRFFRMGVEMLQREIEEIERENIKQIGERRKLLEGEEIKTKTEEKEGEEGGREDQIQNTRDDDRI